MICVQTCFEVENIAGIVQSRVQVLPPSKASTFFPRTQRICAFIAFKPTTSLLLYKALCDALISSLMKSFSLSQKDLKKLFMFKTILIKNQRDYKFHS